MFTMNGKTVFRWTSVGRDWDSGNSIGIQHIYPGSQIGLDSDPTLLQTALNMGDAMGRWSDGNGTVTFYPAAARVGYDPATILSQLDSWIKNNTYPNPSHSHGRGRRREPEHCASDHRRDAAAVVHGQNPRLC
jgi:alpha-L-fucosidase 2